MSALPPKLINKYTEERILGMNFFMIEVPAGSFMMGSEKNSWESPMHEVELDTFYMGQHAVTQNLWKAVMGAHPSSFRGDRLPIEQVSWEDAQLFLNKLNGLLKLQGDRKYRLPTEAEWEYAARGGPYSLGSTYAGGEILDEVGWYVSNSEGQTHEVGSKAPNELGIYDMSGNVWEWCKDWYGRDYYKECYDWGVAKNPQGPKQASITSAAEVVGAATLVTVGLPIVTTTFLLSATAL